MWPRVRCLNQTLLNYEFGVNSTSKLRVDHSKSTQTRETNGKMWYSENCHVTALKVNTRVLPMDLDTRVPVISQPASPHHDIDAWGLRFAPRWRSLRWQSSICSSWRKKVWGHHRGNSYLAIFASVVTAPARGRDRVLVLNLRWNYNHCCARVL